jgi:hypothetical protein
MKRRSKRLALWAAVSFVAIFTVYYASVSAFAASKEKAVNEALTRMGMDPSSFLTRYPKREANATAEMLAEMVEPDVGKLGLTGFNRTPPWQNGWSVLDLELEKATDEIAPLPEDVKHYLKAHAGDFAAMYEQVQNDGPEWKTDLSALIRAPLPNLAEHRAIVSVILLDCLNKTQQARSNEALESFKAAWKINQSLRRRPELISQIVAISNDERLAKTIRKMREVPHEWQLRLIEHDYRKSIQFAFVLDIWVVAEAINRSPELMFPQDWGPAVCTIATGLGEPYIRLMSIQSVEAVQKSVAAMRERDFCSTDYGFAKSLLDDNLAWWNRLGYEAISNLDSSLRIANVAMLQLEAAQKVLRIKEVSVQTSDGMPPLEVSGLESSLYSEASWLYEPLPEGNFSMRFSREMRYIEGYHQPVEAILAVKWHSRKRAG